MHSSAIVCVVQSYCLIQKGFSHPKSEMQYFVSNSESKILVASATEIGRAKPIAEELGLELLVLDPHQFPSAHGSTTYNDGNFGEEEYLEKSAMIIYTR